MYIGALESLTKARVGTHPRAWEIGAVVLPAIVVWLTFLWIRTDFSTVVHWPPSVIHAAFIPLSFALWMAASGVSRKHDSNCLAIVTAPVVYLVAMLSAIAAAYPPWDIYRSVAIAVLLNLVLIHSTGWKATVKAIVHQPRAACVAIVLGGILYFYAYLHEILWQYMSYLASYMVSALAIATGISLKSEVIDGYGVHLHSSWFGVKVFAPCSGIDGITLCVGLLSVVALWDWSTFRRLVLWRVYAVAVLVFVLANAVRITALLLAGHLGSHPIAQAYLFGGMEPGAEREAGRAWVRDTVLMFFHEHIGWSFYIIVFYGLSRIIYSLSGSSPLVLHSLDRRIPQE